MRTKQMQYAVYISKRDHNKQQINLVCSLDKISYAYNECHFLFFFIFISSKFFLSSRIQLNVLQIVSLFKLAICVCVCVHVCVGNCIVCCTFPSQQYMKSLK